MPPHPRKRSPGLPSRWPIYINPTLQNSPQQAFQIINTQHSSSFKLKLFKSCCIHTELHKIFKFQFDLEGQGHQFSNTIEIFR